MAVDLRPATRADLALIETLFGEAVAWLAAAGEDQWQPISGQRPTRSPSSRLLDDIAQGAVHLACDSQGPVSTLTLDDYADPEFWSPQDAPSSALYVHRMIVARRAAGQGIGADMLDWATEQAIGAGRQWLRLDAWRSNLRLHDYYKRCGFTHVRTVELAWRGSGALFQKPVHR